MQETSVSLTTRDRPKRAHAGITAQGAEATARMSATRDTAGQRSREGKADAASPSLDSEQGTAAPATAGRTRGPPHQRGLMAQMPFWPGRCALRRVSVTGPEQPGPPWGAVVTGSWDCMRVKRRQNTWFPGRRKGRRNGSIRTKNQVCTCDRANLRAMHVLHGFKDTISGESTTPQGGI